MPLSRKYANRDDAVRYARRLERRGEPVRVVRKRARFGGTVYHVERDMTREPGETRYVRKLKR